MAILTKSGRIVIAESIALRPLHLAWGTGDGAWVSPPSEDVNATALQHELGRRTATEVGFVTPDAAGEIILPSGRFTRSVSPTNYLFIATQFNFGDETAAVIREIGVFAGTQTVTGLPPGQQYFTPDQIANPGRLLHLQNLEPIYRSPVIRPNFQIVIAF